MLNVLCSLIGCCVVLYLKQSAYFGGLLVLSCLGGDRRTGEARGGKGRLASSHSPLQSRQQMSVISLGTEINDVSPLFFSPSFFLDIFVSLVLLPFHDLLFSFSGSDLTSLLPHPWNIPHSSFLCLILSFPLISFHTSSSLSP